MFVLETPKDILQHARNVIEKVGWTKEVLAKDENGEELYFMPSQNFWTHVASGSKSKPVCFCMNGAIDDSKASFENSRRATAILANLIKFEHEEWQKDNYRDYGDEEIIALFNDDPETTKEKVLNIFDQALGIL